MTEFTRALRELSTAQKPAKGVSVYSRYVNRPAGRVLAALSFRLGLSPNAVTLVSAAFTFAAIAAVAAVRPTIPMAIGVYAALALGFAFDSADGQVARLTGRGSRSGEWLDHVVDCAKSLAVHMAVLVSLYRFFDLSRPVYLLTPVVFQFVTVLTFFGGILAVQLNRGPAGRATAAPPSTLRSLLLLPADYGLFCVVFLFLAERDVFLALYGAMLAANLLLMAALLGKWFRELR